MVKVVSGQYKASIATVNFSTIRFFSISISKLFLKCYLINEDLPNYSRVMISLKPLIWCIVGILMSKCASDNIVSYLYKFENM